MVVSRWRRNKFRLRKLRRRRYRQIRRRYFIRRPSNGGAICRMRFYYTNKFQPATKALRYFLKLSLGDISESAHFYNTYTYYRQYLRAVRIFPKFNVNLTTAQLGTYIICPLREDIGWDATEEIVGDEWLTKPHAKTFRCTQLGRITIKPAVVIRDHLPTTPTATTVDRLLYSPWLFCGSHSTSNLAPHYGLMTVFPADSVNCQFLIIARVYVHFKAYSV